jgi:hypothetical protein
MRPRSGACTACTTCVFLVGTPTMQRRDRWPPRPSGEGLARLSHLRGRPGMDPPSNLTNGEWDEPKRPSNPRDVEPPTGQMYAKKK